MKIRFITLLFILCAVGFSKPVIVKCNMTDSAAINTSNFPDKNLRKLIKRKFDTNKNNILSSQEIKKAKKLVISLIVDDPINLQGLSLLKNLQELELYDEVKSYQELNKLKNLKDLYIGESSAKENAIWDLSGIKKLKRLEVNSDDVISVKFPLNIQEICINSPKIKKLDLRKYKKLKTIQLESAEKLETLDLRNCTKLQNIWSYAHVSSLKKLQLKNMEGLKVIIFESAPKLKSIDLSKAPRLEDFEIHSSVTKFNLNKATKLRSVTLSRIKDKTLDISKLSQLFYFYCCDSNVEKIIWGKKKKLNDVTLNNNKLKGTLNLEKLPYLNSIDCSNNNLDYIYAGHHKNLKNVVCFNNNLKKLDLSFLDTSDLYFSCKMNPNLVILLKNKNPQKNYINDIDRSAVIFYKN